jgi:type IV pilus assembly protein PilP
MRRVAVAVLLLAMGGCGDEPAPEPPARPGKPPPTAAAAAGTPVAALAPTAQPKEALLAEVRSRTLGNEDFLESDVNRDPFRSYLATFAAQVVINKQHKILMEKFSLDELKLIAIIGGNGLTPRAMFVEPSPPGAGVLIQRGDHISKADALVTRIAPDRVFVQIQEDEGGGKTRTIERVLELHAGEGVQ